MVIIKFNLFFIMQVYLIKYLQNNTYLRDVQFDSSTATCFHNNSF